MAIYLFCAKCDNELFLDKKEKDKGLTKLYYKCPKCKEIKFMGVVPDPTYIEPLKTKPTKLDEYYNMDNIRNIQDKEIEFKIR